jgi:hypothetical protein
MHNANRMRMVARFIMMPPLWTDPIIVAALSTDRIAVKNESFADRSP